MSNPSLSKSALKAWQVNAQTWDKGATIDGNIYWKRLQQPCLERLVGPRLTRQGDVTCNVLELSTGNGICARWMAGHGGDNIKIYATDGSAPMVETAIAHGTADGKIQFDVLDVTEKTDFDPFLELANKVSPFCLGCGLISLLHFNCPSFSLPFIVLVVYKIVLLSYHLKKCNFFKMLQDRDL